jgi:hypothetical protein
MTGGEKDAARERGPGARPSSDRAGEERPEAAPRGSDGGEALERILAEARTLGRDVYDLVRVAVDRARLGARSGAFRLVLRAWLAVAGLAATVISVYFIVQGLSDLVAAACGGREWAGRIAAGALALATIGVAFGFQRGRTRRAALRRLEARYGEPERASHRGEAG